MQSSVRLSYFDIRGRAEASRILLHAAGVSFDDHRVTSSEEWQQLKPKLPFGSLPRLESGATSLFQSQAILRELDRQIQPTAASLATQHELDMTQEVLAEAQEHLWRFAWTRNWLGELGTYVDRRLRPTLSMLSSWLTRHDRDPRHWVGDTLRHVDCLAFCYLDEIDAFVPTALAEFPALAGFHARIESVPGIADYLRSGARPPVFGMGITGPKIDARDPTAATARFHSPWSEPIELVAALERQRHLTKGGSREA